MGGISWHLLNVLYMKNTLYALFFCLCGLLTAQDDVAQRTLKELLNGNQEQVIQLAEAFSEEQYAWRPEEGISSVGEALLHVASANYFLCAKMGFPPPAEVDVMGLGNIKGKENIIAALKASNSFVLTNIDEVKTMDLESPLDLGFRQTNTMGGLLMLMEHNGEHKDSSSPTPAPMV